MIPRRSSPTILVSWFGHSRSRCAAEQSDPPLEQTPSGGAPDAGAGNASPAGSAPHAETLGQSGAPDNAGSAGSDRLSQSGSSATTPDGGAGTAGLPNGAADTAGLGSGAGGSAGTNVGASGSGGTQAAGSGGAAVGGGGARCGSVGGDSGGGASGASGASGALNGALNGGRAGGSGSVLFSDDFEDGNSAGWTGSSGTWSVVSDRKVYAQTSTDGGSPLLLSAYGPTSWTNQTVEAKLKLIAFGGQSVSYFAAILARYDGTHYYALLSRSDGKPVIRTDCDADSRVETIEEASA